MSIPVIVWGAAGRMGKRCLETIRKDSAVHLADAVDRTDHPALGSDVGLFHGLEKIGIPLHANPGQQTESGVVLDFSVGGTSQALDWALSNNWRLVSGATGLPEPVQQKLIRAAETIAVLSAPNFSIGIQLLLSLVEQAASLLPGEFEVAICETHHNRKVDRPSGTANAFRNRIIGKSRRKIDVASLRVGEVIGEHSIRFVSHAEEISFSHTANSRDLFAYGAIQAVRWISDKVPGLYSMKNVIGLE